MGHNVDLGEVEKELLILLYARAVVAGVSDSELPIFMLDALCGARNRLRTGLVESGEGEYRDGMNIPVFSLFHPN